MSSNLNTLIETYNKIAIEFDNTRYRTWTCTELFLDMMKDTMLGIEIGCGNGKNLVYRKDLFNNIIGFDMCENFVKICNNKKLEVLLCNMQFIPFKNNIFDFAFCIAVLHHLDTKQKRINAINEMLRILNKNGKLFINVWAIEQDMDAKRQFKNSDELVSWTSRTDGRIYYRYYHLYKQDEILEELYYCKYNINIIKYFYEKGNWGVIIEKI